MPVPLGVDNRRAEQLPVDHTPVFTPRLPLALERGHVRKGGREPGAVMGAVQGRQDGLAVCPGSLRHQRVILYRWWWWSSPSSSMLFLSLYDCILFSLGLFLPLGGIAEENSTQLEKFFHSHLLPYTWIFFVYRNQKLFEAFHRSSQLGMCFPQKVYFLKPFNCPPSIKNRNDVLKP